MFKYNYKYQNFLRNNIPSLGPLYTSFVVALELQMEDMGEFSSIVYPNEEMAEIG
jgi:hypothetical protein